MMNDLLKFHLEICLYTLYADLNHRLHKIEAFTQTANVING
jgi:hypothetical protein